MVTEGSWGENWFAAVCVPLIGASGYDLWQSHVELHKTRPGPKVPRAHNDERGRRLQIYGRAACQKCIANIAFVSAAGASYVQRPGRKSAENADTPREPLASSPRDKMNKSDCRLVLCYRDHMRLMQLAMTSVGDFLQEHDSVSCLPW